MVWPQMRTMRLNSRMMMVENPTHSARARDAAAMLGARMSILRGRDRGRFPLRQGGADEVGYAPNKEATTPHEGKSARSRRVGKDLCSYAAFDDCLGHRIGELGRPYIRSPARIRRCGPSPTASHGYTALPTRLTQNTHAGSWEPATAARALTSTSRMKSSSSRFTLFRMLLTSMPCAERRANMSFKLCPFDTSISRV